MKLVTYNVHKCRGLDGRIHVSRIADLLGEVRADIVALQEVFSSDHNRQGQVELIATALEMNLAFGCTRHVRGRPYGNAILSRWPITESGQIDLSWRRRHQRGCLRADVKAPGGTLHVFNIHMGTSFFERRHQVRRLLSSKEIDKDLSGPRVLVGDFNEWTRGLATRLLAEKFESLNMQLHIRRKRTYPGILPLLHLDHIYFERPLHVDKAELVRSKLAMMASDHLPLAASFYWDTGEDSAAK